MLHPTKNRLNILNSFPSFDSENGSFSPPRKIQEKLRKYFVSKKLPEKPENSPVVCLFEILSILEPFSHHFRVH